MKMIEPWFGEVVELEKAIAAEEKKPVARPLTIPAANEKRGLENAAPFKLHRRSDYPPLTRLANRLFEEMEWPRTSHKGRKTRHNYVLRMKHNLRSALIDVIAKYEEDPTQYSAFSRNHNDYRLTTWLNEAGITCDIITCVDVLARHGYIESIKGINYENYPRRSRIRATEKLIQRLGAVGGSAKQLYSSIEDMVDVIRLKDAEKRYIDYEDTEYTVEARALLTRYNTLMSRHDVSHAWAYQDYAPLSRKTLYRVFNNGSWRAGGRYAGAAYQNMGKSLRPGLLIDGQSTVELDYSATFPTLAYNLQGKNYWEWFQRLPVEVGDPYRPFIYASEDRRRNAQFRQLNKKILNTFLMTKSANTLLADAMEKTRKVVQQDLNKCKYHWDDQKRFLYPEIFMHPDRFPGVRSLASYIQEFLRNDGSNEGLDWEAIEGMFLMFVESEIATRIMEIFTNHAKPVLVVHDSFLVKKEDQGLLSEAMESAWAEVLRKYSRNQQKAYQCKWKIVE